MSQDPFKPLDLPKDEGLRDLILQAVSLNREGKRDEALRLVDEAIRRNPDCREAYEYRFHMHSGHAEFDDALLDMNEILRLAPEDAEAYARRGKIYEFKGEYERAAADASKALALDRFLAEAYLVRAISLGMLNREAEAQADMQRHFVLTTSPERLEESDQRELVAALARKGSAAFEAGRHPDAVQAYSAILLVQREDHRARHQRGRAYHAAGDLGQACTDLIEALRLRDEADRTAHGFLVTAQCKDCQLVLAAFPYTAEGSQEAVGLAETLVQSAEARESWHLADRELVQTRVYRFDENGMEMIDWVWVKNDAEPRVIRVDCRNPDQASG
jgi:tetratricopeptide (TPR) repeat protein